MVEISRAIGRNIQKILPETKMTAKELAKKIGISPTYLSYIINSKRLPSYEVLAKIADALNVTTDRLTGESVSSIIEERLKEIGTTLEEVAKKAGVPLDWLKGIDDIIPMSGWDREDTDYTWITKVAEVLGLPGSIMRAALARQEPPTSDGPISTPEEDFTNDDKMGELVLITSRIVKVPILGQIPAGVPVECEENIIGYVDVPESEVSNGEYFYLKVQGDSMVGSGIMSGYTVLVRKQKFVENGEIAIIRVNNKEATLKRVKKINGQVILYPDNSKYEPIVISNEDAEIIGKVVKVEFDPNKKY